MSSSPFSPRIFLFADIVTDDELVALLRSTAVALASFMLGYAPKCRIKHETKKPFVESSSGEHLKTASVSLPMTYQLASTMGGQRCHSNNQPASSNIPGCPRRGHSGSTAERGASLNLPAVASSLRNAVVTTCSFSSEWILHVE